MMNISLEKNSINRDEIIICGAGPSGLTAAINLAESGFKVKVFEKNNDCGKRFHGDFQGLENWSSKEDILDEMNKMNISIDRINSDLGYTKNNIQLVSAMINRMKSDLTSKEFIDFCSIISNNYPAASGIRIKVVDAQVGQHKRSQWIIETIREKIFLSMSVKLLREGKEQG